MKVHPAHPAPSLCEIAEYVIKVFDKARQKKQHTVQFSVEGGLHQALLRAVQKECPKWGPKGAAGSRV